MPPPPRRPPKPGKAVDNVDVTKAFSELGYDADFIAVQAITNTLQEVRRESRKQVPKDERKLEKGIRYRVNGSEGIIYASARKGGSKGEYALLQHEDLEAKHANGEKAKYLEDPFNEIGNSEYPKQVREALQKRLRSGKKLTGRIKRVQGDG